MAFAPIESLEAQAHFLKLYLATMKSEHHDQTAFNTVSFVSVFLYRPETLTL